jgi:hypothetical protein
METRLRMLIVLAGLPEPRVNHVVRDAHGVVLLRFDLSYPGLRIVVEYDGRQHRDDLDQWDHDLDRKDWFDAEGWLHVPVFSRGIYRDPRRRCAASRPRCGPGAPYSLAGCPTTGAPTSPPAEVAATAHLTSWGDGARGSVAATAHVTPRGDGWAPSVRHKHARDPARRQAPARQPPRRSRSTRWLASLPGDPMTQPPGCVPDPHW